MTWLLTDGDDRQCLIGRCRLALASHRAGVSLLSISLLLLLHHTYAVACHNTC